MPDKSPYATSIAGWSFALAKALDHYDLNSRKVFSQAGIELDQIATAAERLPVVNVQKVWRYAYEHSDEYFGVVVSQFIRPTSLHALGAAVYASSTFRELLERLVQYRCVLSHNHFSELLLRDGKYVYTAVDQREIKTNITYDAMYSYIVRLGRELIDPGFQPVQVNISRLPRGSTDKLEAFFSGAVEFDTAESSLVFSTESLEQALPGSDPKLAAQFEGLLDQYIAELGLISEYMLRVKNSIRNFLAEGEVSVHKVAESLNVTVRTLQRRLATEKSSYNDVLDAVRQQMAMDFVNDLNLSATEIGYRLGFSDSGSFGRSFKRWTGKSFSDFRNS